MLDIRNAVLSLIACVVFCFVWKRTRPSLSSTRRINAGVCTMPRSANAPYAAVSDSNVTSLAPSASDGTLGGVPTLSFFAYATAFGMPIELRVWTAARLLDVRNAARIVIAPPDWCLSSGAQGPLSVGIGSFSREISVAGVYPCSNAAA